MGAEVIDWGLYIEDELLHALALPESGQAVPIESRKCLCTVISIPLPSDPFEACGPMFAFAASHGIHLAGPVLFLHLRLDRRDGRQVQALQAYAPLE